MNNSWQHLAVPSVILRIRNTISRNYLEDDVIIVQNINAQRPWGEEWQSLDQSLRLEENPTSLARKNPFFLGDVFQPVLGKLHCSSRPTGTHLWPWNMFRKCFHFSKPTIPLQGIEVQCSFCDRKFNFYFILNSLPLTQSLRHFLELGELATRRFLGKRQKNFCETFTFELDFYSFFF